MVRMEDVRALASTLPRTTEGIVGDQVRFRVGRIVYLGFSRDERFMGFAFPKEERQALVDAEPHKFVLPEKSTMRYNWAAVRLEALAIDEMRELVIDAWTMAVPKSVATAFLEGAAPD